MSKDEQFAMDYIDVAARIAEFRTKHPEGSFQPVNLDEPFRVLTIGEQTFICYTAAAYRTPDDPRPGVGCAYEQFPGRTPYTRGSELQNAETSAWGRAIVAALAADTKKGVASADEVRNRRAGQNEPQQSRPQSPPAELTAKQQLWQFAQTLGMSAEKLANEYTGFSNGGTLQEGDDAQLLAFLAWLKQDTGAEA